MGWLAWLGHLHWFGLDNWLECVGWFRLEWLFGMVDFVGVVGSYF